MKNFSYPLNFLLRVFSHPLNFHGNFCTLNLFSYSLFFSKNNSLSSFSFLPKTALHFKSMKLKTHHTATVKKLNIKVHNNTNIVLGYTVFTNVYCLSNKFDYYSKHHVCMRLFDAALRASTVSVYEKAIVGHLRCLSQ